MVRKRAKKAKARRRKRRRQKHAVTIKLVGSVYRAIPGRLRVRDDDNVEITNRTRLLWQVSEPNGVLQLVAATATVQTYRIVAGGRRGKFPYQVYLHDGGTGAGAVREFAEGSSAPHIII